MTDTALEEIDLDYAMATADRANRYMVQHGIPPTPDNFAIWFSYARGTHAELKQTIDVLVAGRQRFDAVTNRQLFSTYLASGSAAAIVGSIPNNWKPS